MDQVSGAEDFAAARRYVRHRLPAVEQAGSADSRAIIDGAMTLLAAALLYGERSPRTTQNKLDAIGLLLQRSSDKQFLARWLTTVPSAGLANGFPNVWFGSVGQARMLLEKIRLQEEQTERHVASQMQGE